MKKTRIILGALVIFAAVAVTAADSSNRVKIYHKGELIEVAPQAVSAHLSHGDTVYGDNGSSTASRVY